MVARQVAAWAQKQDVEVGRVRHLDLPAELRHASANGTVHVGRLDPENVCLLLIEKIGYKGNFEGLFFCTRKLTSNEVVRPEGGGAPYLSIPGFEVFEELYIKRLHDEQTVLVYFDMN